MNRTTVSDILRGLRVRLTVAGVALAKRATQLFNLFPPSGGL
jgi:hypothetical protein